MEIDLFDANVLVGTELRTRAGQREDVMYVSFVAHRVASTIRAFSLFVLCLSFRGGLQAARHLDDGAGDEISFFRDEKTHGIGDVFVTARATARIARGMSARLRSIDALVGDVARRNEIDRDAVAGLFNGQRAGENDQRGLRGLIER